MPARLAQLLVHKGLLPPERASDALHQLAISGDGLDTVLLERGWVPESALLQAMSETSGLRPVNLSDFEPNPEVAPLIPPKIAERLDVVPLSMEGNTLHVACAYPVRKAELDEVGFLLGKQLELWVAIEVRIRDWISVIYKQPLPARFAGLLAQIDPARHAPSLPPSSPPSPPSPPSRPSAPPPPPSRAAVKPTLVEESTLEDALTREMVDRLAQAIADEPIPLVHRRSEPAEPVPAPAVEPPPAVAPVHAPPQRTRTSPEFELAPPGPAAEEAVEVDIEIAEPPAPQVTPVAWGPPQVAAPPAPSEEVSPLSAPLPMPVAPAAPAAPSGAEPATDAERDVVPDWTLAQARAALKDAAASGERERLMDVALKFARRTFDFVAAFAVIRGAAVGWDARGEKASREQLSQVSIPLDSPSVFRTVALSRGSFTGPLPPDNLSQHFVSLLGRGPRAIFLFPIEVKTRLVALLYGDSGHKPVSQRRLSDLLLLCQDLPSAFQELILKRKQRALAGTAPLVEEPAPPPTALAPELLEQPAVPAGLGWSPFAQSVAGRTGRTASMPAMVVVEGERPPPDFAPILRRLTGPDATERARAMAELARSPEASSRVLAQHFPGPTAWSRLPVVELPEADELGPIPGALVRLGRPAAVALAPLLDADDSDTRYLALLTAGNLPYAELVDGVMRGLFDFEPDISSAARAAATALRKLPRFDGQMRALRQELAARDPIRRALAARALGVLHDRDAIDGLVGLTGSDDVMTGQAAAEALREITRQSFGLDPRLWQRWWAENRGRRRIEWLVAALRHEDVDLRMAAIEELTRVLNDSLGYLPEAPPHEREEATQRWEAFIQQRGRAQRLDI